MGKKLIADRLLSALKISIFIMIASMARNVYAEYYLVAAPAPSPCSTCTVYKVKYYKVKHYKKHVHKVKKHRPRCYASGCCGRRYYYERRYYDVAPCGAWAPAYSDVYYAQPEYYQSYGYNPDMATGDDNACANPDLQIND